MDKKNDIPLLKIEKLKEKYDFDLHYASSFYPETCVQVLEKIIRKLYIQYNLNFLQES